MSFSFLLWQTWTLGNFHASIWGQRDVAVNGCRDKDGTGDNKPTPDGQTGQLERCCPCATSLHDSSGIGSIYSIFQVIVHELSLFFYVFLSSPILSHVLICYYTKFLWKVAEQWFQMQHNQQRYGYDNDDLRLSPEGRSLSVGLRWFQMAHWSEKCRKVSVERKATHHYHTKRPFSTFHLLPSVNFLAILRFCPQLLGCKCLHCSVLNRWWRQRQSWTRHWEKPEDVLHKTAN